MDMKSATETVAQTTPQYIGATTPRVAGYFFLGGAYALVTAGPILLTAVVCAVSTVFDRIISGMLRDLVNQNIISVKTFCMLHNTVNVLSCTALIITGIYLNILGPVAIACIALNIIMSLGNFNEALKAPQPLRQQPQQPPQPAPALPVPQRQQPHVPPPVNQIPQPQYLPPFNPSQPPPPYEPLLPIPSAPPSKAIWKKLNETECCRLLPHDAFTYAAQSFVHAESAPEPHSENTQVLIKLTTHAMQIAGAYELLYFRGVNASETDSELFDSKHRTSHAAFLAAESAEMARDPQCVNVEKALIILKILIELQEVLVIRARSQPEKQAAKYKLDQLMLMRQVPHNFSI